MADKLNELAGREAMDARCAICPLCGDDNFDAGGLVRHFDCYCEMAERLRGEWAEEDQATANAQRKRVLDTMMAVADFAAGTRATQAAS